MFNARRLLYHPIPGLRALKKKKKTASSAPLLRASGFRFQVSGFGCTVGGFSGWGFSSLGPTVWRFRVAGVRFREFRGFLDSVLG